MYSLSQWNTHPLSNGELLVDARKFSWERLVSTQYKGSTNPHTEDGNCTLFWMMGGNPDISSWITIPCGLELATKLLICESPQNSDSSSIPADSPTARNIVSSQCRCQQSWTYIDVTGCSHIKRIVPQSQ